MPGLSLTFRCSAGSGADEPGLRDRDAVDLSSGEGERTQVDGIFGPLTDRFVRGFQTAVGTTSDGIVGPITWRAMVSGMLAG